MLPESFASDGGNGYFAASDDGAVLAYRPGVTTASAVGLAWVDADGTAEPEKSCESGARQQHAVVSPDGRWIAFQSSESGSQETFVRPFPNFSGGRWQVSTAGDYEPKWVHDERTLYFRNLRTGYLMAVAVETGDSFVAATPVAMLDVGDYVYPTGPVVRTYDVAPDDRFLFMKPQAVRGTTSTADTSDLVFVQNWLAGLEARDTRN